MSGKLIKKLNVALIGLGWVGVNRHIKAIKKTRKIKLIGVIDRRANQAKNIASNFNLQHFSQSDTLSEVKWLDKADLLVIATPPSSHYRLAKEALSNGLHVLVEKPFTLDVCQAEELLKLAEDKRLKLSIVHNFQFSKSFSKLLSSIETEKIGTIRSVVARQFSNPNRRLPEWYDTLPLGLFYDESPHLLYLLKRFSKTRPKLLNKTIIYSPEKRTPSLVEAVYLTDNEIPLSLHMSFDSPVSEWHFAVFGSQAVGIVDLFRDIFILIPNDKSHSALNILNTSLNVSFQHWRQVLERGTLHFAGQLLYGNDIMYKNLSESIFNSADLEHFSSKDAIEILKMQHELIEKK